MEALVRRIRWRWLALAVPAIYTALFLAHASAGHGFDCSLGIGLFG